MSKEEITEALKNIKIRCHSKSMKYDPIDLDLEVIEKVVNTFNIIKEKYVNVDLLSDVSSLEEYNSEIIWSFQRLTQEEFDTLKEVLEWVD